jgi:hypothetical protein
LEERCFSLLFPAGREPDVAELNYGESVLPIDSSMRKIVKEELRYAPLHRWEALCILLTFVIANAGGRVSKISHRLTS